MKLIAENDLGNVSLITEEYDADSGKKTLYIEGIFAQSCKENRNQRIYPKPVLERAIDKYVREYVNTNKALGELLHPTSYVVNPERACILVKSLVWNGNDVMGRAKVLSTPQGEIVKSLLRDGVVLGVSTRGMGSIKNEGTKNIVEDDYTIAAIDVVSNPSGIDCWVNGILENVEFYYKNGVLTESTVEEYQNHVRKSNIKTLKEDFNKFLNGLVL